MLSIRYLLGGLLAFLALNAFVGGIYAMSGAAGVPTEWLAGSPFDSYFLPGLVLFTVVGGTCTAASILIFANRRRAIVATLTAAVIVTCWIATQIAIIGVVSWLQPLTLAAAAVVGVFAWELEPQRAIDAAT
jgi:hypothetical protein